jgi:hypothetical protein
MKAGLLKGIEGLVIRKRNRLRFVILLDLIRRSVSAEVDAVDLELPWHFALASEGHSAR